MGLLGKFLGKKKDDLGLDDMGGDLGPGMNEPLGSPDAGYGAYPSAPSTPTPGSVSPEALGFERVSEKEAYPGYEHKLGEINIGKDLELISAKLDAIKAELDSMNQRLKRMERIAEGEHSFPKDKWSY
ncbi:hypothetical protein AYK26_06750 [Euryarchaeota archaeon SM23-78]|nr:MAG: hypothetical protein AYK26_06750 [Euryarchaeota archaeon SM23-78]MBW3001183.1 hypothetical protein [Candidatus Woesearchaeota archaeon]